MPHRRLLLLAAVVALFAGAPAAADPPNVDPVADGSSLRQLGNGRSYPDPSLLHYGGAYWLFGTGRNIPASHSLGKGKWAKRSLAMPVLPAWADPSDPETWAPDVWVTSDGTQALFVMYFTAKSATTGRHCVGVATAAAPGGPYTPTSAEPTYCSNKADHEVIDPTHYTTAGRHFMVFKDNFENKTDFKIRWLEMNPTGLSRAGTKPRTIVKAKRAKMENPAFVEHGGLLWMFLSRQDYTTCDYYTDAWSAPSLFETFTRRKRLSGSRLTRAAEPGGLCGPGGASVFQDGAKTRITLHDYRGVACDGCPRPAWSGVLFWDALGLPSID